jgi:hypothetical protein
MFKQNLQDLLFILDQEEVPEADAELLRSAILQKVDNCALVKREMEDEAARLRGIAKEFTEAARASEKRQERFLAYVRRAMESQGYEKLPGTQYQLELRTGPEKLEIEREPTIDDYSDFPAFVRDRYEWNKSAIKLAISDESHDIPFARIVREKFLSFSIRKGAK